MSRSHAKLRSATTVSRLNFYQHAEHYFRIANADRGSHQQGAPPTTMPMPRHPMPRHPRMRNRQTHPIQTAQSMAGEAISRTSHKKPCKSRASYVQNP